MLLVDVMLRGSWISRFRLIDFFRFGDAGLFAEIVEWAIFGRGLPVFQVSNAFWRRGTNHGIESAGCDLNRDCTFWFCFSVRFVFRGSRSVRGDALGTCWGGFIDGPSTDELSKCSAWQTRVEDWRFSVPSHGVKLWGRIRRNGRELWCSVVPGLERFWRPRRVVVWVCVRKSGSRIRGMKYAVR